MTDLKQLQSHYMTDAQRAKLPGYVRDYITRLERDFSTAETELFKSSSVLDSKYDNPDDKRHYSGIIVGPHSAYPLAIHREHNVRFWIVPEKEYFDVHVAAGGWLSVSGNDSFKLRPQSANVVSLKMERW